MFIVWPDSSSGRALASWSWGQRFESEPWHHGASLGATLWISPVWDNKGKIIILLLLCSGLLGLWLRVLFHCVLGLCLGLCAVLLVSKFMLNSFCLWQGVCASSPTNASTVLPHTTFLTYSIFTLLRVFLRSSSDPLSFRIPRTKLTTYGPRSFSVAAPIAWNKLPLSLRQLLTLSSFKSALKTHLFSL
jgi:hypothetical protein